MAEEVDRTPDGPILRAYYGLGGAEEESQSRLGRRLGLSHQRIAQRRARGVGDLRARLERRGIIA